MPRVDPVTEALEVTVIAPLPAPKTKMPLLLLPPPLIAPVVVTEISPVAN